jgi:hypothetical protein
MNAHLTGCGWVLVVIKLERFEHTKGIFFNFKEGF